MLSEDHMGELEGQSSPEADALPLAGLWPGYLMVCLIVLPMRVMEFIHLFVMS